jgi:hypothetical protein
MSVGVKRSHPLPAGHSIEARIEIIASIAEHLLEARSETRSVDPWNGFRSRS